MPGHEDFPDVSERNINADEGINHSRIIGETDSSKDKNGSEGVEVDLRLDWHHQFSLD